MIKKFFLLIMIFLFSSCSLLEKIPGAEDLIFPEKVILKSSGHLKFTKSKVKRVWFEKTPKEFKWACLFTVSTVITRDWKGEMEIQGKKVDLGFRFHMFEPFFVQETNKNKTAAIFYPFNCQNIEVDMKESISENRDLENGTEMFHAVINGEEYSAKIYSLFKKHLLNPVLFPVSFILQVENPSGETVATLYSIKTQLDTYWLSSEEKNSFEVMVLLGLMKGFFNATYNYMKMPQSFGLN